jgi:hypothetical protein
MEKSRPVYSSATPAPTIMRSIRGVNLQSNRQFAVPRYVPACTSASTICSTVISAGSKVTVLISLIPRIPLSTFFTPCSPSRAAFPTSYQAT